MQRPIHHPAADPRWQGDKVAKVSSHASTAAALGQAVAKTATMKSAKAKQELSQRSLAFAVHGVPVQVETDHRLPLVDVALVLKTGATLDPQGYEGQTRLLARLVRMGTRGLEAQRVEETIAGLGARLSIEVGRSSVTVAGSVIRRNAQPFVELLARLIEAPALRTRDLGRLQREALAELSAVLDDDRALAAHAFRRTVHGEHPYGRTVMGSAASLRRINRKDLLEARRQHWRRGNALLGFAGDIDEPLARRFAELLVGALDEGKAPPEPLQEMPPLPGRRLVLVDKPERSQTQVVIGGHGLRIDEPAYWPMLVGNHAFGGSFTSRLTHEVRSVRGWSYGASSRFSADRQCGAWWAWTFPAAGDTPACAALELELIEAWIGEGLKPKETAFAKQALRQSHCFEVDTASKRLEQILDQRLYGLGPEYTSGYDKRVAKVTHKEVNTTLRQRLDPKRLVIVVLATASDLSEPLRRLPGIDAVEVVGHTEVVGG